MKILFITNNFPPIIDGVGDYTYNIAKQFAEHNHKVYIICKNDSQIRTNILGITILPIINQWDYNCYKPVIRFIKEKAIDVVSLQYVPHGFHPKGLPFSIIKLTKEIKRNNTKLFTFFHEVSVEKEKGNIKRTLLSILMQHISKRIIENSDYIATSIEYYRNMILRLVPDKREIPLIPIASNIPETKLSKEELFDLKKTLAPNNETIISFFGIRNIQTSIDAIYELKKNGQKLKVLLIGKTSKHLPNNLPTDTIKTGTLDIEEIDQYLKISDIFILPENNDSGCSFKSGSLAAGLRNNLPIITTKGKLTSEKLCNQDNIFFCSFITSNEVKERILYLLNYRHKNKILKSNIHHTDWYDTYNTYINIINNNGRNICNK